MKRIYILFILFFIAVSVAVAQPILPYISNYIRTLLNDPDASTARTTLGLGSGDSPTFTNLALTGYGVLSEISTPASPDPNKLTYYAKYDGEGTTRFYILDKGGTETDLTGGGGGATTLGGLQDITFGLTPYVDGQVLRADGDKYIDAVLSHNDLSDIGSNVHSVIDSHLASTANPHSITVAQVGAVALTGDEIIVGVKTFSSFPLLPSSVPTSEHQAAPKDYVDAVAQGLEVKLACRVATTEAVTLASDFEDGDTIDGVVLSEDDRILIKNQADATKNGIYTVEASGAPTRADDYDISAEVQEGTYTFITDGTANGGFQFVQITIDPTLDSSNLVFTYLSKPTSFTASLGAEIVGTNIRADLLASGALGLTGNELKINVDDSSIEISGNAIQVKASGVTNTMLAGSIADSKLATIGTADKVDWVAVNKTGSVLNDIANVNAPTPSDDQALAWDAVSSKWVPQTITAGGGGVNAAVMDVDLYSSGTVDAAWTNMPVSITELFGTDYSRVKVDLTYATHFRLVVNQTVAGYAGADFDLQYSTDNISFLAADAAGTGEVDVGSGVGIKVGDWAELVAGGQADVWLRIAGKDGNAKVDPRFRQIRIQFKMLSTGGAAPTNAQYLTLAVDGTLSQERTLVGTAGQITVTDGGAGANATLALVNYNDSEWDDAYDWGDHSGLYLDLVTYDVGDDGFVDGNDTAYGAAWNGDVNAPTMNAVYDEIETKEDALTNLASLVSTISDVTKFFVNTDIVGPSADPDVAASGVLGIDTDGANEPNDATLRIGSVSGNQQYALAQVLKSIQCTIITPNDLADGTRDALPIWENNTGMAFHITMIRAWSDTDDTTVNVETYDSAFANNATVDALEIASDGTANFYVEETTITAGTIAAGSLIVLDFDDTDDPGWVKINIMGWFDANVD